MTFNAIVKERIARTIGEFFTTNQIVNVFDDANIPTDKELFAKWRIILDAFSKISDPDDTIPRILLVFCHPLHFNEPQVRKNFIARLNTILDYANLTIQATDKSAEILTKEGQSVGTLHAHNPAFEKIIQGQEKQNNTDKSDTSQRTLGILLEELDHSQALYYLRILYNQLILILDAVASGYLIVRDEHLNVLYLVIKNAVEALLSRDDMKHFSKENPELYETIIGGEIDDIDVEWEFGKKQVMNFYAKIEKEYVLSGAKSFSHPKILDDAIEGVKTAVNAHIAYKHKVWKQHYEPKMEEQREQWQEFFALDYTDTSVRKAYERKWDVLQEIRGSFESDSQPDELLIPIKRFTIKDRAANEIDGILKGLSKNGCFKWHRGTEDYQFQNINRERLLKMYDETNRHYDKFAKVYQEKAGSSNESRVTEPLPVKIVEMPEVSIKGLEGRVVLQKNKDKKIQLRKFPDGMRWQDITIQFLNGHEVIVTIKGEQHQANYEIMGFEDAKKKQPNQQWIFLRLLAEKNGELSWDNNSDMTKRQIDVAKKKKQSLADALRAYFQIDEDPFEDYRKEKAYRIKVNLISENDQ